MQSLRCMKQQIHLGGARSTVVCIFSVHKTVIYKVPTMWQELFLDYGSDQGGCISFLLY